MLIKCRANSQSKEAEVCAACCSCVVYKFVLRSVNFALCAELNILLFYSLNILFHKKRFHFCHRLYRKSFKIVSMENKIITAVCACRARKFYVWSPWGISVKQRGFLFPGQQVCLWLWVSGIGLLIWVLSCEIFVDPFICLCPGLLVLT